MSRPHYHPDERYIVVLKGTWYTDEGDVFQPSKAVPLKPGDFMRHPKGGAHYVNYLSTQFLARGGSPVIPWLRGDTAGLLIRTTGRPADGRVTDETS